MGKLFPFSVNNVFDKIITDNFDSVVKLAETKELKDDKNKL